jgi:hypothetical protein
MLRDTSTSTGNRLLLAEAGGTITTGLSRITISDSNVIARNALSPMRLPGVSLIGVRA